MTPNEIREEFARIRQRYEGVCDAIAPVRVSRLEAIEKHITALEAEVNAPKPCPECGTHSNLFEIDTTRERPGYVALERANIDRLKEGSPGMDAVAAEIERLRNAGLRDRAINATKGCL